MKNERGSCNGPIRFGLTIPNYHALSVDSFISNLHTYCGVEKDALNVTYQRMRNFLLNKDGGALFTAEEIGTRKKAYTVFQSFLINIGVNEYKAASFISTVIWRLAEEDIDNYERLVDRYCRKFDEEPKSYTNGHEV